MRGYDVLPYLPILQSLKGSPWKFLTDKGIERLLVDDYYTTLNDLYLRDHVGRLTEWTHSFGYKYRAQSYGGDVNTAAASCILDVAEGEDVHQVPENAAHSSAKQCFRALSPRTKSKIE